MSDRKGTDRNGTDQHGEIDGSMPSPLLIAFTTLYEIVWRDNESNSREDTPVVFGIVSAKPALPGHM